MRRAPSRRSLTSPAPCKTRRCCEIACLVTSKCSAMLPAVISSSRTSRRISRRRGSTIASIAACTPSGRVAQLQVDTCASICLHSAYPANAHKGSRDVTSRKHLDNAAGSSRFRAIFGALACAGAGALALAGGMTSAQAATRCTWGGTPANPTGTISFTRQGLTQIPAPFALPFRATGVVEGGGPCHGQVVTFDGQADAGSSCTGTVAFEGGVIGLPGVASLWGRGVANTVRELDYDKNGTLVGSDQAIIEPPSDDPAFSACNTAQGFKSARFSGEWDLFSP